MFQILA
ncbi:hypothetical protein CFP56_006710 [Quercus suber]